MDVYRIVYTEHARVRMAERKISRKEISHAIALGTPIEKDENATPYPCEVIFCRVRLRALYVVVGINHADKIKIVVTAYESGCQRKERKL
jgi:hypothetical protein